MSPKLLLVLSPERRSRLLPLLEGRDWEIECAAGFQDGVRRLSERTAYDLILADAELPDGSWRNLMLFVQNAGKACEMIICSRLGDHSLWAEVIQCGAYDLIAEPFERQEVARIIQSALESRYMRRFTSTKEMSLTTPV
jgi:DNA-binding NtrC family response regulator